MRTVLRTTNFETLYVVLEAACITELSITVSSSTWTLWYGVHTLPVVKRTQSALQMTLHSWTIDGHAGYSIYVLSGLKDCGSLSQCGHGSGFFPPGMGLGLLMPNFFVQI
jgi:hypothetical protein